jgi:hypothetical protein
MRYDWSSWQGYGFPPCLHCLTVSISCAAVLDRFLLVGSTWKHCDCRLIRLFCSFLGLFAPVHAHKMRKSEAELTGCSLQHFYSWVKNIILMLHHTYVLKHHTYATERIANGLLPSDSLNEGRSPSKYFVRAQIVLILDYIDPLTTTEVNYI